jgi:hypothetical protein
MVLAALYHRFIQGLGCIRHYCKQVEVDDPVVIRSPPRTIGNNLKIPIGGIAVKSILAKNRFVVIKLERQRITIGDLEKLQFFEVNLRKSNSHKGINSLTGIAWNL